MEQEIETGTDQNGSHCVGTGVGAALKVLRTTYSMVPLLVATLRYLTRQPTQSPERGFIFWVSGFRD